MKITNFYIVTALTCISFCLGACKEDRDIAGEQGTLQLSVGMSDKITVASRTLSSEEQTQLEQACKVRIYNETSLVRKYEGTDNVPSSIPLMSGTYSVRVTAGDSVAASFDQRFFEGNEEFTITKGQQSPVEVKCGIANTVLTFTWDESLKEAFEGDCQVTVTSATGELVYSSANADAKGYFSLPADNRKLTCKFTATKLTGGTYEQTTELTDAQPATLYNMTCKYTATGQETTGGAWLTLSVDETPLSEETTTIWIKQRPVIVCKDADNIEYDLEQPMYLATNTKGTYYLIVSTSSPLKGALLQNDRFTEFGVPANSMDLMNLGGKDASVEASGISLHAPNAIMETGGTWKIQFSEELIAKMTAQEGQVTTTLTATDKNGKQRMVTWNIVVSNATVATTEAIPYEIWTSKATLHGKVTGTLASTPKFQYRVKGSGSSWTVVDADLTESTFSKEITGLNPGTTYEYQAMDGTQASTVTCEFTTETTFQPDNASFEYTQTYKVSTLLGNKDCLFFYQAGKEMWWDTGNTGSATAGKNLTTQDSNIKNSGNYSAKLASANIMGTFAAGNLFTGKFLGTEDMTKGILGWGRPCTSRPKALKVWVRYTPGTVDKGDSHISNGETDKGIIYVAVGDWKSSDSAYGSEWPIVVRTKGPVLFNPHDEGTIGYGEHIFTENYGTETETSLKEITIPLDYEGYGGYNRKPETILIVASASQYGDYYEGSSSSVMWLDDMELIYE
ncbi:DUF4493 domain-containing protein [Phocaeicola coprophilus]|uniref:DUF4493 domain-containing protein n=1 Tax=Phocaeicola coprophilus TaxID=387090 RepID=UPI00255C5A6E|nr:DUF4493 domain-containing protein [Phocaeicola coprophilus]